MRVLLLIAPGLSDEASDQLEGLTPLQAAATPHLDALAGESQRGTMHPARGGPRPCRSDLLLSVLGYDPRREQARVGPLEAVARGVTLQRGDLALRAQFVSTFRGQLVDLAVGPITTPEARALLDALQERLGDGRFELGPEHRDVHLEFVPGAGHRHLLVLRGGAHLDLGAMAPDAVAGRSLEGVQPEGCHGSLLSRIAGAAREVLQSHDVNRVRVDLGSNPADALWLWGEGPPAVVEPFALRTGRSLAVVACDPLAVGLGRLVAAEVREEPPGEDALGRKARAALDALDAHDVVALHVSTPSEACFPGDARCKAEALARLDRALVGPLVGALRRREDTRLVVLGGRVPEAAAPGLPRDAVHPAEEGVPFVIWQQGAAVTGSGPGLRVDPGHTLLDHVMRGSPASRGATGTSQAETAR